MYRWKVWGSGLEVIYIYAVDCDTALRNARKINKDYCAVQMVDMEDNEKKLKKPIDFNDTDYMRGFTIK